MRKRAPAAVGRVAAGQAKLSCFGIASEIREQVLAFGCRPAALAGHRSLSASARILGGHWLLRSAGCYERSGLKVDGCIVELSVERVHFAGFSLGELRAMGVLKPTEQERRIAARCSAGLESARISCLPGDRPSVGQPSTPCGERPLWRLSSANYRPSPVVHRAWSWTLEGAATVDCA